jgi:hypothetical protein
MITLRISSIVINCGDGLLNGCLVDNSRDLGKFFIIPAGRSGHNEQEALTGIWQAIGEISAGHLELG